MSLGTIGLTFADTTAPTGSNSMTNWPRTGSTARPSWRNATRLPMLNTLASSSGFSMPATCFCMAASDSRMTAERTRFARRSRICLSWMRSKKEYSSETGTNPARCQPESCLAEICRIRSMSERQNRFM